MLVMNPIHLQTLLTIVDEGSFEDAAYVLGISPSAVSQRIKALEKTVGRLLLRRGTPVSATEAGEVLMQAARRMALLQAETMANLKERIATIPLSVAINADSLAGQVRMRAERTGALHDSLYLAAESNLDVVFGHVDQLKPSLLIVDSVQTMNATDVEGVAGGVAQSRAVTAALTTLAKTTGIPVLLVGHVTKDGNVAGPRVLEHLVDVVLNFEGDRHSSLRMLRGIKNRFGATDEVGCFEQQSDGIKEIPDPSGLFLSHRDATPDGTAVTVAMDGVRPIVAEVQALVVPTESKNPRRAVTGLDATRVPMVLAVLAARAGRRTHTSEVYVATVGGMKVGEPATDLAIAMATVSAITKKPLPAKTVVLGEVGLAGEIRRVPNVQRRLMEAKRLGYRQAVIPAGSDVDDSALPGLRVVEVATIHDALRLIQ